MEKMLATMTTKPNYESEIIKIVKGNGSPKVILNQLENYHGSDIADVMEQLNEQERKKIFRNFRLYWGVLDACYADFQCCWHVDSAVLQKNQGRSGSCFRPTDYNCKRPCCSCHLLWYELDSASEHLEVGLMIFYDSQIQ